MYASELAERKRNQFLIVYADQPAEEAAEMLASIDPQPEVIVLAKPAASGWQYALLIANRAAYALAEAGAGQTAGEVFDDRMQRPAAILKPSDPVDPDLMFFVVEEDGVVVGCYYPEFNLQASAGEMMEDGPGKSGAEAGESESETSKGALPGASPSAPQKPPERYLQTEFPESLVVGEEGDLGVWITCIPDEGSHLRLGSALNLAPGEMLDVVVRAEVGLKLTGKSFGRLAIPQGEGDSPRLMIRLRAERAGMGRLKVYCMRNGASLGAVAVTVTIYADEEAATEAQPAYHSTVLPPMTAGAAPTLTLWVFEERIEDQPAVRYLLNDAKSSQPPREYGPLLFSEAPRERFSRELAGIEAVLRESGPESIEDAKIELQLRGETLFQDLFPPELQSVLAERLAEIESIHILSQEAWIPWEIVRVYGADAAGEVRGRYLCEYLLTRWNPDYAPQPTLSLKSIGLVSPGESGKELFKTADDSAEKYQITYLPGSLSQLVTQLAQGAFTCLHFEGHGRKMDATQLRSSLVLEEGRALYAQQFGGSLSACGRTHPLVFLNTCQAGTDAPTVTGLDGWANQFLSIGAAAFIGTHWSVGEQSARAFAAAFYGALAAGEPAGAALRTARQVVQQSLPSLDWLAYAGFCDPAAQVK